MANKTKAKATTKEVKEKRSFTVYEKKGNKFTPTTTVLHSRVPTSAAKKAGNYKLKANPELKTTKVYLREAGVHDRVREYDVTLAPHYVLEPTGFSRLPEKGFATEKVFVGDEPEFIKRNIHFATHPIETATGELWTDEAVAERNAEWLPEKVGIKLLPGKHIEIRGVSGFAKFIRVHQLPEGTVMSARVQSEPVTVTKKEKKPKKGTEHTEVTKEPEDPEPPIEETTEET